MARSTRTASKTPVVAPVVEDAAVEAVVEEAVAEAKAKKTKEPRFTPLDPERMAWIADHARPAVSVCLCGCGGSTKGRFMPGHDATLKESLKATAAWEPTEEGESDDILVNPQAQARLDAQNALQTFGW